VRTRIVALGACILGTTVTSALAWAAVDRVETRITTSSGAIVSPRGVDRAVASLVSAPTTEPVPTTVASPGTTGLATGSAPSTAPPAPSTVPGGNAPTGTPSTTRGAPNPGQPATTAAPPTVAITTTTAPKPSTTTAPNGQATTVIPTAGGTVAVACPTPDTIRLEYATPNPGYLYSPVEITSTHVQVKFTKSGHVVEIEAECSGGRVETSFENDD
jgi:hypothetical protein